MYSNPVWFPLLSVYKCLHMHTCVLLSAWGGWVNVHLRCLVLLLWNEVRQELWDRSWSKLGDQPLDCIRCRPTSWQLKGLEVGRGKSRWQFSGVRMKNHWSIITRKSSSISDSQRTRAEINRTRSCWWRMLDSCNTGMLCSRKWLYKYPNLKCMEKSKELISIEVHPVSVTINCLLNNESLSLLHLTECSLQLYRAS